jgi:hypothetical protein
MTAVFDVQDEDGSTAYGNLGGGGNGTALKGRANGNSLHLWMDDGEDTHIWLAGPGYEETENRKHLYGGPF